MNLLLIITTLFLALGDLVHSIITNPGEDTRTQMNISWAADTSVKKSYVEFTLVNDTNWSKSKTLMPEFRLCKTYDSIFSKTASNKDFYERVVFNKCDAALTNLKKDSNYKYRVIGRDTSKVHYFKTSGAKGWSACVISDIHAYSPLYSRTNAAMNMVDAVASYKKPIDWVLHLGDVCAWGGSYSFWQNLYREESFHKYMWAGVNGNHDDMTRDFKKVSNEFTRDANFYPRNGYAGQEGVCYFFKYGEVLFIMLNSEAMKTEEGLLAAQNWMREVVKENPSKYVVVNEHYHWFDGVNGKEYQYAKMSKVFDELEVDLALAGNNHIYVRTNAIYNGVETSNGKGTVYIQTPSSDNGRGRECNYKEAPKFNPDKIKSRWTEGPNTVGALYMEVAKGGMTLTLLNRRGEEMDKVVVLE